MTMIQRFRAKLIIATVAMKQGISVAQCRNNIQEAIDHAWATTDPEVRFQQIRLVGDCHTPTPEEFIFLVSEVYP